MERISSEDVEKIVERSLKGIDEIIENSLKDVKELVEEDKELIEEVEEDDIKSITITDYSSDGTNKKSSKIMSLEKETHDPIIMICDDIIKYYQGIKKFVKYSDNRSVTYFLIFLANNFVLHLSIHLLKKLLKLFLDCLTDYVILIICLILSSICLNNLYSEYIDRYLKVV
jgi:hypothetical protein